MTQAHIRWLWVPVNPQPWKVPPFSVGKRGGKYFVNAGRDAQLHSYKEAVAESLADEVPMPVGEYSIWMYFFRKLEDYDASEKRHRKHVVDATNLQKAFEDALQGVLIHNDRNVRYISSEIVEQGPDVATPGCLLAISMFSTPSFVHLPNSVQALVTPPPQMSTGSDNTWNGPT